MSIRGNAYHKTTWAFQERPVASAKLNSWDDRIEAALELVFFLLSHAWGGGNGVVRGATSHDLKTIAMNPPGLAVQTMPGYAFISRMPFKLGAAVSTPYFSIPTSHPRIDLVQARLDTWGISVKIGTESASPGSPVVDADCISLARIYLRPGMAHIQDIDDGVNGYILDTRSFV